MLEALSGKGKAVAWPAWPSCHTLTPLRAAICIELFMCSGSVFGGSKTYLTRNKRAQVKTKLSHVCHSPSQKPDLLVNTPSSSPSFGIENDNVFGAEPKIRQYDLFRKPTLACVQLSI